MKFSETEKQLLCLAFAKERLTNSNLTFDENTQSKASFFSFVSDYAEAKRLIDDHVDQLPF